MGIARVVMLHECLKTACSSDLKTRLGQPALLELLTSTGIDVLRPFRPHITKVVMTASKGRSGRYTLTNARWTEFLAHNSESRTFQNSEAFAIRDAVFGAWQAQGSLAHVIRVDVAAANRRIGKQAVRWIPVLWASFAFLSAQPLHASSVSRTCFANSRAFMAATYGPMYASDENLKVTDVTFGKARFSMVEDLTSGTNHSITLLRQNRLKKLCVVLQTTPTVQLEMTKVNAAGVPVAFRTGDQAPPGLAEHEIIYHRTGPMRYSAVVCNLLYRTDGQVRRKRISCRDIAY